MITYDEAKSLMIDAARTLPQEKVALDEAVGRILAQDIHSDIDMPPFDKSAMDGYACRREDLETGCLTIIEEVPAGSWPQKIITRGTCARILTGAPVPRGADCVVMQEHTEKNGTELRINKRDAANHICRQAEDIAVGDLVIKSGERITPAHIAVMASVGAVFPLVARQPRIAIFATGSELVDPSVCPGPAQIRNSNSWQLTAQIRSLGAVATNYGILSDKEDIISEALSNALESADMLLLSGGVSTGDYDLVPGILKKLGFEFAFQSVAVQPGRPTVFGQKGSRYCCGLPGNPIAAFVILEMLVKPFLLRIMGHDHKPLTVEAEITTAMTRKKGQRQICIPVRFVSPGKVEPLPYHGPAHINTMILAEGLIISPFGAFSLNPGDKVQVRCL
jgi:molybdopterin molybdotransferase